jgi:DNA-directed RNA polymerase subunit RPC12/RpoP
LRETAKRYIKAHPRKLTFEEHKRKNLKYSYGLSLEDYMKMLLKQSNRCLICGREFVGELFPVVDHNHKTKEVRGLLCNRCNLFVGLVEDRDLHQKIVTYVVGDTIG